MIDFDTILESLRSYIENHTGFEVKDFPVYSERLYDSRQTDIDRVGFVHFNDDNPWNIIDSKRASLNIVIRFRFKIDHIRNPDNYTEATALTESYPILLKLINIQNIPPGIRCSNLITTCGYDENKRYNVETKLTIHQP